MSTTNFSDNLKNNFKTMDEIEMAFLHIINDFRQIDDKYGLMVDRYINDLYVQRRDKILEYYTKLDSLHKQQEYVQGEYIEENRYRQLKQLNNAIIR